MATTTSTITTPHGSQALKSKDAEAHYLSLSKPLVVDCLETSENAWRISTITESMSLYGACFALRRPISPGRAIHLVFPGLHYRLRHYDHADHFYKIWALVRSCEVKVESKSPLAPKFIHNATFFGRLPPSNYYVDPTAIYDFDPSGTEAMLRAEEHSHQRPLQLCSKSFKDRRKNDRYSIPYEVTLTTFTDEGPNIKLCERTITENVSSGGALIRTMMHLERGSMVWVTCDELQLRLAAVVRRIRTASTHSSFNYLHLQWVGGTLAMPGLQ